jgi:mevalonate kinase
VRGLAIEFTGNIPVGSGLGSGGAAHVALALAVVAHFDGVGDLRRSLERAANWAYSGDRLAHGGTASALDTQTSLHGGIIEFRDGCCGTQLQVPPGLRLVIGQTGVPKGSTSAVNGRVRDWLEKNPARIHYFTEMGHVAGCARQAMLAGDWRELGLLMNLNQLLLERVGVSHPRLDELCEAALRGGALGAKLTGAGGGGCMIALVNSETEEPVARAIEEAGGIPLRVATGVAGARQEPSAPGSVALEPMASGQDTESRGHD